MAMIIAAAVPLCKDLFDLKSKFFAAKKYRRDAVATYFDKISEALSEAHAKLTHNQRPTAACAKLRIYETQMKDVIGDFLTTEELNMYVWQLSVLADVRFLRDLSQSKQFGDEVMHDLEEGAARFKALADCIRLSK